MADIQFGYHVSVRTVSRETEYRLRHLPEPCRLALTEIFSREIDKIGGSGWFVDKETDSLEEAKEWAGRVDNDKKLAEVIKRNNLDLDKVRVFVRPVQNIPFRF